MKKVLLDNLNKILIVSLFLLFTIAFWTSPFNKGYADFINDYYIIKSKNVLCSNYFFGSIFYNLIVLFNANILDYNLLFSRIINFITSILIILFSYFILESDDKKKIGNIQIVVVFFLICFFALFQSSTLLATKIMILFNLLSYILFRKSLKDSNRILLFFSLIIQILSFYLGSIFVYLYMLKKYGRNKQNIIAVFAIYSISLALNVLIFLNLNFDSSFKFLERTLYSLTSFLVPINRLQQGEYIIILYVFSAIFSLIYLIFLCISSVKNKDSENILLFILIILNFVSSILFYNNSAHYYSTLSLVNGILIMFSLSKLSIHLVENNSLKYYYISFENIAIAVASFIIILTSIYGISIISTNKKLYENALQELDYASKYDGGRLSNGDLNIVYEGEMNDILGKYAYFKENNLLVGHSDDLIPLPWYSSKDSVRYIRGYDVDDLGEVWLGKSFSFEAYAKMEYITITIFSIVEENEVDLYVNNRYAGKFKICAGPNELTINISEFLGQDVIIFGFFDNVKRGPLNEDGLWSCEVVKIDYSTSYGVYPTNGYEPVWSSQKFGEVIWNVDHSMKITVWVPNGFDNIMNVYINNELKDSYEIKPQIMEIYIDLSEYYGTNITIDFSLEKYYKVENDQRNLGIIIVSKEKVYINNIDERCE